MTVNHLLLTAFYKGWHVYVRYLIIAIAPLSLTPYQPFAFPCLP